MKEKPRGGLHVEFRNESGNWSTPMSGSCKRFRRKLEQERELALAAKAKRGFAETFLIALRSFCFSASICQLSQTETC